MDNIPTSVAEFVRSQSFSSEIILLQHDDKASSQTPSERRCSTDSGRRECDELQKQRILENAARVALLLTRSFDDLCCMSKICHDEVHRHHLSSIELDDFFIILDKDSSKATGYGRHQHRLQPGPLGNCNDFYDYFNQLISEEEEKKKKTIKDRNGKVLGLGYFSLEADSSIQTNNDDGDIDGSFLTEEAGGQGSRARPDIISQESDSTIQKSGSQSARIVGRTQTMHLYEIDIVFPTRMDNTQQQHLQHSKATPMQILGRLLFSVFCRGKSPPFDVFKPSATESASILEMIALDADEDEDGDDRSSKTSRSIGISVFSQLVDSKTFPISVCRLLSDLIGTGPNGTADSPFASFQDVIHELEQMISQPLTYLHDSRLSHGMLHSPVLFGQVYYGRDEEVAKIIKVAAMVKQSSPESNVGVESVFVSGIAGSGKSQLVQTACGYLSNLGWTFVKAKFERGAEHASRGIISSMFDEIISHLVKKKEEGSPSDVARSQCVSKTILDSIDRNDLSPLIDFLPSLHLLIDGVEENEKKHMEDWQLIYSLSKILEAVLQSGFVVMICDDLQWADRTTLALISEVLAKLGENLRHIGRCCLFIGLYREDEVDDDHPFSIQYSYLQMSSNINTTEIKLSGLSKKDVADMITAELRLSRRLVGDLADVVYKKTSGHAYFIVELLNSLLRDNIIAYSPRKYRYAWDQSRIDLIQTGESVAELIASNLSSLPGEFLRVLRILSCFGIQTDIPLLTILENFEDRIISFVDEFIERGILDQAGPIIIFTHDLIQQEVYEGMPLDERHLLHLQIGQFLGELASIDASSEPESAADSITIGMNQLQLLNDQTFFVGSKMTSSLISIACEQIDSAGPDAIVDNFQSLRFSEWNFIAGQKTYWQSDFRAALYYYSKGIEFLGTECWLNDLRLCLSLHEGAVFASFALGEADHVLRYSEEVIRYVSFEDTLEVQQVLLKSLSQSGKHNECISRGVKILRQLNFDMPISPTMEVVMNSMASTENIASPFGVDEIMNLCEKVVDESAHGIVKIMDSFYISCYASASAFLPLISCEIVKYALKHGICQESTVAFASYGMFKIFFEGDYAAGKKWADVVRAVTEKHQSSSKSNRQSFEIRAHILLYITIDIWFSSPRDVSQKLLNYHLSAARMGQVDIAMISLQMGWRYLLYGGENLSIVSKSFEDRAKLIAKNSDYATKYVALDNALIAELTGQPVDQLSAIEGMLCNIEVLQAEAEIVNNTRLLHHIHANNLFLAYWRGDYVAAEKSSHLAWKYPTAKMPTIVLIYHTFYGGLIAFQLFRKLGGVDGNKRLKQGREMMVEMGRWAQNSMAVFGNKWLLLSAEHSASINENDKCKKLYEASINVAQDHGNIHELGLAYELFGNYGAAHECGVDASACFKKAYECYIQWGATAVAERVLRNHNLDLHTGGKAELQVRNSKRPR